MAAPGWQPDRGLWRDRSVAVSGATGFLGSHLVGHLLRAGAQVTILVRDDIPPTAVTDEWWGSVRVAHGCVEDQAVVERVLGDHEVRTVLHLAAQSQVGVANRNPVATYESNIRGTWSLLEAVRRSPLVEQVVTASSDKAYGSQHELPYDESMPLLATNPYDVSKACSDLLAQSYHQTYGVPVCITRCGNFFGPGDQNWERLVPGTIRSILRGERPVIRSDGTMVRDYLYVVDGALAYLQIVEAMSSDPEAVVGEAFNLSTETPMTVLELVDAIQGAAGTDLEPEVLGTATHEIDRQYLSAAKARKLLGWAPSVSTEEALARTVDWYRGHLGLPAR